MDSAPKDGTRVLILHHTYAWTANQGSHKTGTAITECRWHKSWGTTASWQVWCGDDRTSSTEYIDPIAWAPVPDELLNDANSGVDKET